MKIAEKADTIRALSIAATTASGSGHPTSCMSAADITTILFDKYFRYDTSDPHNLGNDRFILSKGHAAPLYYALFAGAGVLKRKDLLDLRKISSVLEGHPTPRWEFVDAATGSLGQGLSIAAGMALYAKRNQLDFKSIALLGDGEFAEGQIYEAANFAAREKLNNLITIIDVNRLAQTGESLLGHDTKEYEDRLKSMGWKTQVIDGHNFEQIEKALDIAYGNSTQKPFAIIAKTKKGKGASFLEDKTGHHGKALSEEDMQKALKELNTPEDFLESDNPLFDLKTPPKAKNLSRKSSTTLPTCHYDKDKEYATREVFGYSLKELGDVNDSIYAIDGDVSNSTHTDVFAQKHAGRFIQGYIAEQNMAGIAVGLSALGQIPFVVTFGAFLTRAYDQIRMAAISRANIKFVGSHAGVSIGEDGPSQMALEDIAMFSPIPDSVILHPSDAASAHFLPGEMVKHNGISYLRTLRPKTPPIYPDDETFKIGGSKTLKQSDKDQLVIVAAGISVHEALKAHKELKKDNIHVTIIDAYSIKPLDAKTIIEVAKASSSKTILTVEDHYAHGGLGDMVAQSVSHIPLKVHKLAVDKIPQSGTKEELLKFAGIDSGSITKKAKDIL